MSPAQRLGRNAFSASRRFASFEQVSASRCPLNTSSKIYMFYLTLGFTLPFALPWRESSRDGDNAALKGRSNPRSVFQRLI
ncbi:hypothetical protein ACU8KH_03174 [Lachancea thermotolerans]